jgi:hypothetical protein
MSLDEKQFKIEKIENFIDYLLDDWHNFNNNIDKLIKEIMNANKRNQNLGLVSCGVFLTIIFGLVYIKMIDTSTLEFYLLIDLGVAVTILIAYGLYKYSLTNIFSNAGFAIVNSISNLSAHRLAVNGIAYNIKKLENETIDYYYLITFLIDGSNKIRVRNEIAKITQMKRIPILVRKDLTKEIASWKTGILNSAKIYETTKDEFNKENWKDYQPLVAEIKRFSIQRKL